VPHSPEDRTSRWTAIHARERTIVKELQIIAVRAILAQGTCHLFGFVANLRAFATTLRAPMCATGPGKVIVRCVHPAADLQVGLAAAVDGAVPMRLHEALVLLQHQPPDKILALCKGRVLPAARSLKHTHCTLRK